MQDDADAADFERRIKSNIVDLANRCRSDQWDDNSASGGVKLCGLHHDDEWNGFLVLPGVPVNIKLCHHSDDYSSAIEPESELNLFQAATVSSTTLAFAMRALFSRSTNSVSNDSTTPERLSVIAFAWLTSSSFKVRFPARWRAAAVK